MPLVNISLLKGKSREHLRAISNGVHQALVEAYKIPPKDHFQFIRQFEREDFIYDADYLDIQRSDDVVFIHIIAGNWRDSATKQALYKAIADRLTRDPGLRREEIQIIITANERDEWSFGNGVASYVKPS